MFYGSNHNVENAEEGIDGSNRSAVCGVAAPERLGGDTSHRLGRVIEVSGFSLGHPSKL